MSRILLVDANNVAMRSLHAMRASGLTNDQGIPTGPLLAFANALSKHVREEAPDRVVVCWDGGRSAYRVALYPDYKGNRHQAPEEGQEADDSFASIQQVAFGLAKSFCSSAGLHHVERPHVEADDLIAYYTHQAHRDDHVVILSSDKDFLQLVNDHDVDEGFPIVEQVRLSSANAPTDRYDVARVEAEFGCIPPILTEAMALAGDTSDNIPGVPRFGMKTAIKALRAADWDLDVVKATDRVKGYEERVETNRLLVSLQNPSVLGLTLPPLPPFKPVEPGDPESLIFEDFLDRYQMRSLKGRFLDRTLWKNPGDKPDTT